MNLTVEPSESGELALVSTEDMEALCDGAYIDKESGDLNLTHDHLVAVRVNVGDASLAHNAMTAIRRAIDYGESWDAEDNWMEQ